MSPCPFCLNISNFNSCSLALKRNEAIDELLRSSGGVAEPLVVFCTPPLPDDETGGETGGEDVTVVKYSLGDGFVG